MPSLYKNGRNKIVNFYVTKDILSIYLSFLVVSMTEYNTKHGLILIPFAEILLRFQIEIIMHFYACLKYGGIIRLYTKLNRFFKKMGTIFAIFVKCDAKACILLITVRLGK